MPKEQGAPERRGWGESAPYWKKHAATIRAMFEPISDALIRDADIGPRSRTLDVAGGSGEPALRIAECLGSAAVVSSDVVEAMVAAARGEARRRGLANVTFAQCAAEALPFRTGCLDAVVCRLGVMFFPDPIASLREMLRVIGPGGRVALAVWRGSEVNPFFRVMLDVLGRYLELPAPAPDAPSPFRYAQPGKLAGVLAQAGAAAVEERILAFRIEAPVAPRDYWTLRTEMSESLRALVPRLSAAQGRSARADVEDAARPYFAGDRMSFPAEVILVTGRK